MVAVDSRRWAALAVLALVCSAGLAAAAPADRVLVVEDAATGERLLTVPVDDGTTVTVAYTHSVEKSEVRHVNEVNGTRLEAVEMRFQSYGWGFPSSADVHTENGWFVYDPPGTYESIPVKPGRIAGHRLIVGDHSYDLVALSDARAVTISVERRSVLDAALSDIDS